MNGKLKSRKLWVSVLSTLVVVLTQVTGVELDTAQLVATLSPIIAYILGQSWVDSHNGK